MWKENEEKSIYDNILIFNHCSYLMKITMAKAKEINKIMDLF